MEQRLNAGPEQIHDHNIQRVFCASLDAKVMDGGNRVDPRAAELFHDTRLLRQSRVGLVIDVPLALEGLDFLGQAALDAVDFS